MRKEFKVEPNRKIFTSNSFSIIPLNRSEMSTTSEANQQSTTPVVTKGTDSEANSDPQPVSIKDEENGGAVLEIEQGEVLKNEGGVGDAIGEPPKGVWGRFQYMLVSGSAKKSDDYNVPEISILQLFLKFLWFGCRAFGGT